MPPEPGVAVIMHCSYEWKEQFVPPSPAPLRYSTHHGGRYVSPAVGRASIAVSEHKVSTTNRARFMAKPSKS